MLFKVFLFLALAAILFSKAEPFSSILVESHPKKICEITLELSIGLDGDVFTGFSIFKLCWPFCSVEGNHFSNFGRGSSKEH